ncbi:MAG: Mth938-like domain-containing protein [Candidatus Puniceispirillales bacterium]
MPETPPFSPVIKDYSHGGFTIGEDFHQGSVLIRGEEGSGFVITAWDADTADSLTRDDFQFFFDGVNRPDLIVLGVGASMQHPFAKLRMALTGAGIPLEVQTTAAACRTWNLLLSEGRHVAFAGIAVTDPTP